MNIRDTKRYLKIIKLAKKLKIESWKIEEYTPQQLVNEFWDNDIEIMTYNLDSEFYAY